MLLKCSGENEHTFPHHNKSKSNRLGLLKIWVKLSKCGFSGQRKQMLGKKCGRAHTPPPPSWKKTRHCHQAEKNTRYQAEKKHAPLPPSWKKHSATKLESPFFSGRAAADLLFFRLLLRHRGGSWESGETAVSLFCFSTTG